MILSDFKIGQVVDGELLNASVDDADIHINATDINSSVAQQFFNDTTQPAQISAEIASSATETLTLSQTHSEQHSEQHSISVKASSGIKGLTGFGGNAHPVLERITGAIAEHTGQMQNGSQLNVEFGYSYTWGQVTGESFTSGHAVANNLSSKATLSAGLPPYTEMDILQSTGKATVDYDFNMPILLSYNVTIVYFNGDVTDSAIEHSLPVSFAASSARNSFDARHDLYQRVIKNADEPDGVNHEDETLRNLASKMYTVVPLSKEKLHLSYETDYKLSRLSSVRPSSASTGSNWRTSVPPWRWKSAIRWTCPRLVSSG